MREITDDDELTELTGGDLLCSWTAQGFDADHRAWATDDGHAVAVAGPALATRDRLAVHGSLAAATSLVGLALEEVGPTFRPIGDRELIRQLAGMIELSHGRSLSVGGSFGWMDRDTPLADDVSPAHWLDQDADDEITEFLATAAPRSEAKPGDAGVERWAGIRDEHDQLLAVAALGWSAPSVGYLCGVATRPDAHGNGLAEQVCRLVAGEAIRTHGAIGLMVDDDNAAAIAVYRRLGLTYRPLLAARVEDHL